MTSPAPDRWDEAQHDPSETGLEMRPAGLPREAWDMLDPALQEALLEGRLTSEELDELAGWLDEEEGYGRP